VKEQTLFILTEMNKFGSFACRKWYFGNIHTIQITSSVLKRGI